MKSPRNIIDLMNSSPYFYKRYTVATVPPVQTQITLKRSFFYLNDQDQHIKFTCEMRFLFSGVLEWDARVKKKNKFMLINICFLLESL